MKLRNTVFEWLCITFGTTVIALSVYFFLIPSHRRRNGASSLGERITTTFMEQPPFSGRARVPARRCEKNRSLFTAYAVSGKG